MSRIALLALYPLLVLALTYTALRYLAAVAANPRKALNIALLIDQTANVDANGRVDQSISLRAATAMRAGRRWGCLLCWLLDRIDPRHCETVTR